jgi:hypothetical protein
LEVFPSAIRLSKVKPKLNTGLSLFNDQRFRVSETAFELFNLRDLLLRYPPSLAFFVKRLVILRVNLNLNLCEPLCSEPFLLFPKRIMVQI